MLNEKRITIKDVNFENIGDIVKMFKESRVRDAKGFKKLQLASSREDYGKLNSILSLRSRELRKGYNLKREVETRIGPHTETDKIIPFNLIYKSSLEQNNHYNNILGTNRRQLYPFKYKRNGIFVRCTTP